MTLSVVIPVKNGEKTLKKCLDALFSQVNSGLSEVILIDSGSTDTTLQIAGNYPVQIVSILPGEFNHGQTRNLGIKKTTGELIYFTVQDAWLSNHDMLQKMSAHFTKDHEVAGVYGMQAIPHDTDKNPVIWFRRQSDPIVEYRQFLPAAFHAMTPEEKLQNSRWDNVNAMYKRSALEDISFFTTNYAEDALWAREALASGKKLVYDPSIVTYHYHHQNFSYAFRSRYIVHYTFFIYFGVKPAYPDAVLLFLKYVYAIMKMRELNLSKKFYWIWYNFSEQSAAVLSTFLFRLINFSGGKKMLERSVRFFCKTVPQGRIQDQLS